MLQHYKQYKVRINGMELTVCIKHKRDLSPAIYWWHVQAVLCLSSNHNRDSVPPSPRSWIGCGRKWMMWLTITAENRNLTIKICVQIWNFFGNSAVTFWPLGKYWNSHSIKQAQHTSLYCYLIIPVCCPESWENFMFQEEKLPFKDVKVNPDSPMVIVY